MLSHARDDTAETLSLCVLVRRSHSGNLAYVLDCSGKRFLYVFVGGGGGPCKLDLHTYPNVANENPSQIVRKARPD